MSNGPFVPVLAISRSQSVRIGNAQGTATPGTVPQVGYKPDGTTLNSPYYVDLSDGPSRRDLAHHLALGAVIVVGGLTNSNSDWVVVDGGVVTAGTGLTVNVSAGDLLQRSTGAEKSGASATNSTIASNSSGNPRIDLVSWDNTSGAVTVTTGTAAASPVAPATPTGKTPLATVAVANGASVPGTITDVRPRV